MTSCNDDGGLKAEWPTVGHARGPFLPGHAWASNSGKLMMAGSSPDIPGKLMPLLMARATNVFGVLPDAVSAPSHRADLQVLIVAPAPPSFQLQGTGFTHETGWVLYVQDLFKP